MALLAKLMTKADLGKLGKAKASSKPAAMSIRSIESASAACMAADLPWLTPSGLEAFKGQPEAQGRVFREGSPKKKWLLKAPRRRIP